mmetsp:Transcript_60085/g.143163  ORF Transcript_60085/g.143163 Transcript_60085/m.143163 type:complete len:785 (+) Transcript_60085:135-2489(+)
MMSHQLRSVVALLLLGLRFASALDAAAETCSSSDCDGVVEDVQVQLLQTDINMRKSFDSGSNNLQFDVFAENAQPNSTGTTTTTLDPTGLTLNAAGDMATFRSGVIMYGGAALAIYAGFTVVWVWFPMTYFHNILINNAPKLPDGMVFGESSRLCWIKASLSVTVEEVIDTAGLDSAMMLELAHLGMKIMAATGIPIFCITGPLNLAFGGHAAGDDTLSGFSYGNVELDSWIYRYMGPVLVWYVSFVVQYFVWNSMRTFIERRYRWIEEMDDLRATTLLIQGIPDEFQNEKKIKELFDSFSGGKKWVKEVHIVKDTTAVDAMVADLKYNQSQVLKLNTQWEADNKDPAKKPMIKSTYLGGELIDGIEYYQGKVSELKKDVGAEQQRLLKEAAESTGGVNLSNAFITMTDALSAEMVLRLSGDISSDASDWEISRPPEPLDIQWHDLQQDPNAETVRTVLGWSLTIGLMFAYLPAVIGIQNLANTITFPGMIDRLWKLVAPTMGTLIMVAMLPTFLLLIFKMCFTLTGAQFSQSKLQKWYFWFQMLFLVLIAAIGRDFTSFARSAAQPVELIRQMADTLPTSTHFFMNYFTLAYMTKALVLLRHVPLMKFLLASRIWPPEEAKKLAEPEDQDYYGTGGRMSRWTIFLAIGIIYGTMSPPVNVLAFLLFAEIRLSYGFLLPFAEKKKPSTGGEFWVTSLYHIQIANIIYGLVMAGILLRRSYTMWPCYFTLPAPIFVILSQYRFFKKFQWESLPMGRMMEADKKNIKPRQLEGDYRQPALDPALAR